MTAPASGARILVGQAASSFAVATSKNIRLPAQLRGARGKSSGYILDLD